MPELYSGSSANIPATYSTGSDKITDFEKALILQDPQDTPFYAVINALGSWERAGSVRFDWMEEADRAMQDTTNDAALGAVVAATWMTVDDVTVWIEGHLVFNERTGEYCIVTEVDYANNRVYLGLRGQGHGAAAAGINDNDTWTLLQNARTELSHMIPMTSHNPTGYYNYVQFSSDTMTQSHMEAARLASTQLLSTSTGKRILAAKMREFKKAFVATFYYGTRTSNNVGTPATDVRRTTGGADYWLNGSPTNADMGGAVLNFPDLKDILGFYQAQNFINEAHIFARPEIMVEFQSMFADQVQFNDKLAGTITYNWTTLNLAGTVYHLHSDPVLQRMNKSDIWIFDLKGNASFPRPIRIKNHPVGGGTDVTNGRPAWIENQQANDYSAESSQVVAGYGFLFGGHSFGRHARISNVAHL